MLARNLIREAEHVIRDAEEMEAMFKPVEADEEEGTTAEVIRDILPVTDILMVNEEADVAVIEPPPSKASKSERRVSLLPLHVLPKWRY